MIHKYKVHIPIKVYIVAEVELDDDKLEELTAGDNLRDNIIDIALESFMLTTSDKTMLVEGATLQKQSLHEMLYDLEYDEIRIDETHKRAD